MRIEEQRELVLRHLMRRVRESLKVQDILMFAGIGNDKRLWQICADEAAYTTAMQALEEALMKRRIVIENMATEADKL